MDLLELKKKRIAVLMGGRSGEREVSLRSGKRVLEALQRQGYNAIPLDTDPDLATSIKKEKIDAVYIALHGKYGEDGTVQGLLEMLKIPYTGSKVLASALAMDKVAAKRIFMATGVPTPNYATIESNGILSDQCRVAKKRLGMPLVVKPVAEGSSLGVTIVKNEPELEKVVQETVEKYGQIFVEKFIAGKEVTVGIIGKISDLQALPVLELRPKNEFYDFHAKYTEGQTAFILPAELPPDIYLKTQETALCAHQSLGCYGVSRVDIIVTPDGTPYVHEVNSIPGMTDRSDLPAQAQKAGISFDQLVLKILESCY